MLRAQPIVQYQLEHDWQLDEYNQQVGTPEVLDICTLYSKDLREMDKQFWQKPGESIVVWMLRLWDNEGTPFMLS
jgi:hypothetical protein